MLDFFVKFIVKTKVAERMYTTYPRRYGGNGDTRNVIFKFLFFWSFIFALSMQFTVSKSSTVWIERSMPLKDLFASNLLKNHSRFASSISNQRIRRDFKLNTNSVDSDTVKYLPTKKCSHWKCSSSSFERDIKFLTKQSSTGNLKTSRDFNLGDQ